MLMRDALLCHFGKRMYHGGIGGCALLSLMYSSYYVADKGFAVTGCGQFAADTSPHLAGTQVLGVSL